MYKVELRRSVQKSLEKIQTQERLRIITALSELEQNPRPRGMEKIRGTELYRIRESDYRIVYDINDSEKSVTIARLLELDIVGKYTAVFNLAPPTSPIAPSPRR